MKIEWSDRGFVYSADVGVHQRRVEVNASRGSVWVETKVDGNRIFMDFTPEEWTQFVYALIELRTRCK